MKHKWMVALASLGISSMVLAQSLPPAPGGGMGGGRGGLPPEGRDGGPGGPGGGRPQDDGPPGGDSQGRPGGRQGPGGPMGQGPGQGPRSPIEAMKSYVELIEKYSTLAKDPTAAGISAVVSITELSRAQGPVSTAERLTKLLDLTKDEAVKRAIRLQLIDLYKAAKLDDKAIEQAEALVRQ